MLTETRDAEVMGEKVCITFRKRTEDPMLEECSGYFDFSTKTIVVLIPEPDKNAVKNPEAFQKGVLRHELIHAYLQASGLDASSGPSGSWATNEEMVDWFAIQSPKIYRTFRELELI